MNIRLQFRSRRVTNCPLAEFTQCGEAINGVERHRGWVKRHERKVLREREKDGTKELKRNVKEDI